MLDLYLTLDQIQTSAAELNFLASLLLVPCLLLISVITPNARSIRAQAISVVQCLPIGRSAGSVDVDLTLSPLDS